MNSPSPSPSPSTCSFLFLQSLHPMTKPVCFMECVVWASLSHSLTQSLPHTVKCFYKKKEKNTSSISHAFSSFSPVIQNQNERICILRSSPLASTSLPAYRAKWRLFVQTARALRRARKQTKGEQLTQASSLSHHNFQLELHVKVQRESTQIMWEGQRQVFNLTAVK